LIEASNLHYNGVMAFEVKRFLFRLIHDPDKFGFLLEDMASKIMCSLTWDDTSFSEYHIESSWGLLHQLSPSGPLTNRLNFLWNLPLAINPWRKAEQKRHDEQLGFWKEKYMMVKEQMARGEARPSFVRKYLESEKKGGLSGDQEASSALGMMALISIFTIGGPLHFFFMAMALHQEWLSKCQEEIDKVCGERMPTLSDYPDLPILRACIKETMRWRPNIPTGKSRRPTYDGTMLNSPFPGVAREAETDGYYKDLFIPKGTRMIPLEM
jgi:hypothetical protein